MSDKTILLCLDLNTNGLFLFFDHLSERNRHFRVKLEDLLFFLDPIDFFLCLLSLFLLCNSTVQHVGSHIVELLLFLGLDC